MATTTKAKNQVYAFGASIDANWGPWPSVQAYETWLTDTLGLDAPRHGVCIAVTDGTDITEYISENGVWRKRSMVSPEMLERYESIMQNLPDGQAVSAMVAEHEEKLSNLERYVTQDEYDQLVAAGQVKANTTYYIYEDE